MVIGIYLSFGCLVRHISWCSSVVLCFCWIAAVFYNSLRRDVSDEMCCVLSWNFSRCASTHWSAHRELQVFKYLTACLKFSRYSEHINTRSCKWYTFQSEVSRDIPSFKKSRAVHILKFLEIQHSISTHGTVSVELPYVPVGRFSRCAEFEVSRDVQNTHWSTPECGQPVDGVRNTTTYLEKVETTCFSSVLSLRVSLNVFVFQLIVSLHFSLCISMRITVYLCVWAKIHVCVGLLLDL